MFELSFVWAVGVIIFLVGIITWKFPAKERNYFYGYRTKRAMKSKQAWDFSQKYSAKCFVISGFLQTIFGLLLLLFTKNEVLLPNKQVTDKQAYILIANFIFVFLGTLLPIIITEIKLKKYF